jgi:hypothetical protein
MRFAPHAAARAHGAGEENQLAWQLRRKLCDRHSIDRTTRVADFSPRMPRVTHALSLAARAPPCHAALAIGGTSRTDTTYGPPSAAHKSGLDVQERSCC